ncbi:hypothetical protein DNTS_009418 [Danionella cerebrum]|uniref:Hcy-binding domain-containing protein n=1 Tax=Danionella cerebrum TaxID=2873325 RepID=A0A553NIE7_9TELE|nr:hypothetical protein DNTS_009418 [Danionella translucida]
MLVLIPEELNRDDERGILERLAGGEVVIGDGGFVFALEKRGYVKAGPWTPEAAAEHPEAGERLAEANLREPRRFLRVRQLHREFLRAGSNIMQTFTFYASDDKLENRGNKLGFSCGRSYVSVGGAVSCKKEGEEYICVKQQINSEREDEDDEEVCRVQGQQINEAACDLAREVANEGDALVAGGVSQTPSYLSCKSEAEVKKTFQKQLDVFIRKNVDLLIAEYFEHVEEAEWAVQVLKGTGKPVAATMCIGPEGDMHGVAPGECAVRLVKAGADIVGVNCHFDPLTCVKTVKLMKAAVEQAGLKAHYMSQPLAYHTPDCNCQGFIDLPEFPFALEPRILTRWEMQQYAREAYDAGIRVIGGCCGFEPYHIRAIAEELSQERGVLPEASQKHGLWGSCLEMHTKPWVRARARRDYWQRLKPSSGRPFSSSLSLPDGWGVTKGHSFLMQQKEATTQEQLKPLFEKADEKH